MEGEQGMAGTKFFLLLRKVTLSLLVVSLIACGGGGTPSSPSDTPTTPVPGSSEPPTTPSSEPPTSPTTGVLTTPIVNVVMNDQQLQLQWTESFASSYRVLYWAEGEAPQEATTNDQTYIFSTLNTDAYTAIVEAYDDLGNSLFSAPISVEVQ
jgi:hypothetical protein